MLLPIGGAGVGSRQVCDCDTRAYEAAYAGVGGGVSLAALFPPLTIGATVGTVYCGWLSTSLVVNNYGKGMYFNLTYVMIFNIDPVY